MNLDVALTNHAHSANVLFLNALEEAWHDEPFPPDVAAPGGMGDDASPVDYTSDGTDPEGLADLESRSGRHVEVAIPLTVPVAA